MKFTFVSLITILAATGTTSPIANEPRQLGALGGLTSPLTSVLGQVGKHVPSALGKLSPGGDKPKSNGNSTVPAKGKPSDGGPLGGLGGGLGGLGL